MKRTPLRPSLNGLSRVPLGSARTPARQPHKPMKKNRVSKRFAKRRCRPYLDWLKQQPCCMTGRHSGDIGAEVRRLRLAFFQVVVDPAHVRGRALGGDDLYNAVPLAHHLHDELHQHGPKTFATKYGVDLAALAITYTERFLAEFPAFGAADYTAGGTQEET